MRCSDASPATRATTSLSLVVCNLTLAEGLGPIRQAETYPCATTVIRIAAVLVSTLVSDSVTRDCVRGVCVRHACAIREGEKRHTAHACQALLRPQNPNARLLSDLE